MAEKTKHGYNKALRSRFMGKNIYLYEHCDIVHGKGWFCHIYGWCGIGFGFHKNNRFTAVRNAIRDYQKK